MPMIYTYMTWSALLVLLWGVVFVFARSKKKMFTMSLGTAPLGLTEPLFYPEYWSPPTLFGLGETYGFDVESILFSFSVGGLASSLYELGSPKKAKPMPGDHQLGSVHRFHVLALSSPVFVFVLLELTTSLNSIYTASLGLLVGAVSTVFCRVDLLGSAIKGAVIFSLFYFVFFSVMNWSHPNFVDLYWNNAAISGFRVFGVPIEELLFASTLGALWSNFYEHRYWQIRA
ncbi:lycopene cyclase domain-containing protein [Marinobacter sp.]|uniref:lycopene cyclase domain-containing protein n=1 Tax=Marinobacter sp. TaxID=50741 RepID=UPI003B52DB8F